MKNKYLGAVLSLLVSLCLLCGPATAEQSGDPIVVTVGQVSYPLSLVQYAVNGQVTLYQYDNIEINDELRAQILDSIRDQFINIGLIENKLIENGQNDFTEFEKSNYMTYAQDTYEQIWQGFREHLRSEGYSDYSDEELTAWLNAQGYTIANIYQESLVQARWNRIVAMYCPDVTVTDQEILTYYIENYVEADKARYANDIPTYETEILSNGYDAFYTPEGYRLLRQLLLPYPESVIAEAAGVKMRGDSALAAKNAAYDALAQAAASGEDIVPFKAAYDDAVKIVADLEHEYTVVMRKALPMLKPTTDEIAARLAAGESLEALIAEFSLDDTPLLFHSESEMWFGEVRDAALALTVPGDLSTPVILAEGVGLLYYVSDIPSGPHQLTEEEQATLQQTVLTAYQTEALNQYAAQWKQDYPITVDMSLVAIP